MIQKFSISNDPAMYEAWPDVVLTGSGKLVCVFSECTHHGNRDYTRIMLSDSGRPRAALVSETAADGGDPGAALLLQLRQDQPIAGRQARRCRRSDSGRRRGGPGGRAENVLYFSADDGESWSGPVGNAALRHRSRQAART